MTVQVAYIDSRGNVCCAAVDHNGHMRIHSEAEDAPPWSDTATALAILVGRSMKEGLYIVARSRAEAEKLANVTEVVLSDGAKVGESNRR